MTTKNYEKTIIIAIILIFLLIPRTSVFASTADIEIQILKIRIQILELQIQWLQILLNEVQPTQIEEEAMTENIPIGVEEMTESTTSEDTQKECIVFKGKLECNLHYITQP